MNLDRVTTVIRRHSYVLWRSPNRWFDIVVLAASWTCCCSGRSAPIAAQQNHDSGAGAPYLLAGIMLFHVLFQVQIAMATGFMEETWSRNLLNIMITPGHRGGVRRRAGRLRHVQAGAGAWSPCR